MRKLFESFILALPMLLIPTVAMAQDSAAGPVTRKALAFHSAGHLRLWYKTPLAGTGIDAHLVLFIVIALPLLGISFYYYRRKALQGRDDGTYSSLLMKEKVLKERLMELERNYAAKQVNEEEYQLMLEFYKKKLLRVRKDLQLFNA